MNAQGSESRRVERGTDLEFAQLFDTYLDAVYRPPHPQPISAGRQSLLQSTVEALRVRSVSSVLDCAAGTGFPGLDLAARMPSGFEIHCTDASEDMLAVLVSQAARRGIDIERLVPPQVGGFDTDASLRPLRFDWSDLGAIPRKYDYVMCRGNSLAYARSWGGSRQKVASLESILADLGQIRSCVRDGGYLHVDAPWSLDMRATNYASVVSEAVTISERVEPESDHRRWTLHFELPTGKVLEFEQYSARLTIYEVKTMLDLLGFEDTNPIRLKGERSGFGVIIARKPE